MKRLALALLLFAAPASAQRRVVVAARPTTPPVSEVRAELRAMGPEVQRCVDALGWPGAGPRPRLRLRVWLEPEGRYQLEVPELAGWNDRRVPGPDRIPLLRLYSCLNGQVARRVRPHLRPFRGRRQKIERSFRVQMPGPPPPAAELARRIRGRRAQLLACVPGAGTGEPEELVIRATLGVDGVARLTGLAVPATVPFDAAARCVAGEVAQLSVGRVTAERSFEAVLRYRFTPVAATAPE